MSAAPVDYPPAVLKEAEEACERATQQIACDGANPKTEAEACEKIDRADRAGAQAYAAVLARYTVSQRLVRSPGGVLVLDTPGEPIPAVLLSDEPPVDEDARELAQAYERGRADAVRDAAAWLCKDGRGLAAWHIEENERARLATKQGAASS